MESIRSTIIVIFFLLIFHYLLTDTNLDFLNQFSQEKSLQFKIRNIQAKATAAEQGWQSRIEFPDGKVMELQVFSITGKPLINVTNNAISAQTLSSDEVYPEGLTQISWGLIPETVSYSVYSNTDPEGFFSTLEVSGIIGTSWIDTNTDSNKKFYVVKAVN